MAQLTDNQEMVLALLPIFPSLLSFVCSITILRIVYQHYKTKGHTTVYHRLLVGVSCCDVFVSFWFPWIAFLMPAETSTRIWAIGNNGTCSFMGFLYNFAFTGLLYNASLSYYFLFTARFGWRDKEIAKWVEPLMHFIAVGFPLSCALAFAGLGAYDEQPIGLGCWLVEYPAGCSADPGPGEEQCTTLMLGWISSGLPVLFSFLSLLINNALIYCHVRSTIGKAKRHSSHFMAPSSRLSTRMPTRLSIKSIRAPAPKKDAQARRLQSVAVQAGLYVLVFFLNYIWSMILRNVAAGEKYWTNEHEADLFWLLAMQAIFLPLQGFFNLCVFSRPKYLQTRKKYPNQSRIWAFRKAMFESTPRRKPTHAMSTGTAATANPCSSSLHSNLPLSNNPAHMANESCRDSTQRTVSVRFSLEPEPRGNGPLDGGSFPPSVEEAEDDNDEESETDDNPRRSTSSQPPAGLRRSTSMRVSLLSLLGVSSRRKLQDQSDCSSPFDETNNRALQQSDFDSFLFGCEDYSAFVAEDEENEENEQDGAGPKR